MTDPYITCETWMICPSHIVIYVHGNLPEDQELDSNAGYLPRLILA